MKLFITALLLVIMVTPGHAQLLRGEWEGSYSTNKTHCPIFLEFILTNDSTYSVYSYTKGGVTFIQEGNKTILRRDSAVVCNVFYKLTQPDQVYLEEINVIEPPDKTGYCFQKMYLKIKMTEDKIWLTGNWESDDKHCKCSGDISLWKKREKEPQTKN